MKPTQTLITPDTIRTASLYPLATLEERTAGTARVLVTRYWPRGLKRERVDYWLPDLAPSREMLRDYRTGALDWAEFTHRYRYQMEHDTNGAMHYLRTVGRFTEWHGAITLLCVEHCPRDGHDESDIRCHRRLLRDLLLEGIQP